MSCRQRLHRLMTERPNYLVRSLEVSWRERFLSRLFDVPLSEMTPRCSKFVPSVENAFAEAV